MGSVDASSASWNDDRQEAQERRVRTLHQNQSVKFNKRKVKFTIQEGPKDQKLPNNGTVALPSPMGILK